MLFLVNLSLKEFSIKCLELSAECIHYYLNKHRGRQSFFRVDRINFLYIFVLKDTFCDPRPKLFFEREITNTPNTLWFRYQKPQFKHIIFLNDSL